MSNKPRNNNNGKLKHHRNEGSDDVEGNPDVWSTLDKSFKQVQTVLDRNRALIQQVNENHRSKIADNMVKNVALIQELNGNISKVVSLYSDMSSTFSSAFHKQHSNGHTRDD
ncbi:Protein EARLY FLOWERING 4 [Hibiscus syriacus]|uniref:Protein EARLY FLOWERING 4 n=1 Tax=Hibiscus syriacus TaxID=106335 RepID=A0A6A2ZUM1_HIBSY|nr:protein EARLY FLOWERING 4-like [Hibiscus syriacus]KAE8695600.1 Protein EARLY FLOWERING 4 [Hibiscus syriacus]